MKTYQTPNRRTFIKQMGAGLTATLAAPSFATATPNAPLQSVQPGQTIDEKYWEMVKRQFLIAEGKLMVNAANLCPSPHFIYEKVEHFTQGLARDVSFQNRSVFGRVRTKALDRLAEYFSVSNKEVAITRNTSESNNIVVNGLAQEVVRVDVVEWRDNNL